MGYRGGVGVGGRGGVQRWVGVGGRGGVQRWVGRGERLTLTSFQDTN